MPNLLEIFKELGKIEPEEEQEILEIENKFADKNIEDLSTIFNKLFKLIVKIGIVKSICQEIIKDITEKFGINNDKKNN